MITVVTIGPTAYEQETERQARITPGRRKQRARQRITKVLASYASMEAALVFSSKYDLCQRMRDIARDAGIEDELPIAVRVVLMYGDARADLSQSEHDKGAS
jgi:hypothetical protein